MVADDPVFKLDDYFFNSEEEEFSKSMERSVNYVKYMQKLGITSMVEKHYFKEYVTIVCVCIDTL